MRLRRHFLRVGVFVCLILIPGTSGAAPILHPSLGTLLPGSSSVLGDDDPATVFTHDNDIAFFEFSVGAETTITATMASPAGFLPILTLFGDGNQYQAKWNFLKDSDSGPLVATLSAGTYLLALTQFNNYFSTADGRFDFDLDGDGLFTKELFDPDDTLPCDGFVAPGVNLADPPECRTAAYFGTLATEATTPEPATLSLVALGATALLVRRRTRRRESAGIRTRRPSS